MVVSLETSWKVVMALIGSLVVMTTTPFLGAGSDYLDGGTGADVAKLTGKSTDYSIAKGTTATGTDLYYLTDNRTASPDGVEQLTAIENLEFADGKISLADFYSGKRLNDSIAPTLISSTPATSATGVLVSSNIIFNFSEDIQLNKTNANSIILSADTGLTQVPVKTIESFNTESSRLTITGKTLTLNPSQDLPSGTNYSLQIPANFITDNSNNYYASYIHLFSTESAIAPSKASINEEILSIDFDTLLTSGALYSIEISSGAIQNGNGINYSGLNNYTFNGLSSNQSPSQINLSTITFTENTIDGASIATLTSTDPDDVDTFTYTLVAGAGDTDNATFTIDGTQLRINAAPDYESKSSYSIRLKTNDAGGLTFEKAVTLNVNNINETPAALNISASTFNENIAAASAVATLSSTDPDAADTFTYAFASGTGDTDNAAFTIDGTQLKIKAAPDYETKSSYNIRLKTTDAGGLLLEKAVTLNVNNINEIPTYTITPSATSINEGATLTTSVATTNVASGTTLYYSLSGTGITAADFSSGALTGSGTIGTDSKLLFSHTIANDLTTEGAETVKVKLFFDSARTVQVGDTASVLIVDSSIPFNFANSSLGLSYIASAFSSDLGVTVSGQLSNNLKDGGIITYGPPTTSGTYGTLTVSITGATSFTGASAAITAQSTSTLTDSFSVTASNSGQTATAAYNVAIANPTAENTLLITASSSGSIDGISFGSTATTGAYAGKLLNSINLGSGVDTATLTDAAGTTGALTLNGGVGFDRLNGNASANNLTLTGLDSGTLDLVSFSSIENIYLEGGNDTVTIQAGGRLSGILDGGAGSNSLIVDGSYTISIGDGGTIVIDNGSGSSSSFSGFQSIGGGTNSGGGDGGTPQTNRLTLNSNSNVVAVTGPNSGTADGTAFTNISDIDLAAGDDYAVLAAVGSLTGTLKGGGGVDDLTLNAGSNTLTLDYQGTGSATSNGNTTATKLADFEIIRLDAGSDTANLTFAATSAISDKQQLRVEGGIDKDSVALNLNQKELSNLQTTNQFTALQAYLTAPTGKSITVNLLQTSLYLSGFETGLISIPTPTYTLTPSATSINEGEHLLHQ
ncbi:Ig-like domain-containing protein [Synechococcus lacustris Tous-12m]